MDNFILVEQHNWSIRELEEMMPWEREVYIDLVSKHVEQERARQAEEENRMKSSMPSMPKTPQMPRF